MLLPPRLLGDGLALSSLRDRRETLLLPPLFELLPVTKLPLEGAVGVEKLLGGFATFPGPLVPTGVLLTLLEEGGCLLCRW